jgi:ATP-dependent Lhr-like helicase
MACAGDQYVTTAFKLIQRAGPMVNLTEADFDTCLNFLSGKLSTPTGAMESEASTQVRWTSPRLWSQDGRFGLRSRQVTRWFWNNVGTINSEELICVLDRGVAIGTLEAPYAEQLLPGDHFILDGRALEFQRLDRSTLFARPTSGNPKLPRWTSSQQSLSLELAHGLAAFRAEAGKQLLENGPLALHSWLAQSLRLDTCACGILANLFEAQAQRSEIPSESELLVESSPSPISEGLIYTFHAPLHRAACEALGRATAARLGREISQDLTLCAADMGWSIHLPDEARCLVSLEKLHSLFSLEGFTKLVLEGVDRGELQANRFRHIAATALMVLRNPKHACRVRVGGLNWVSKRLYPLVKARCPDHPLLRETQREVLEDILDVPAAMSWIAEKPRIRFRELSTLSPFATAWIEPGGTDTFQFEPPAEALHRLHARLALGVMETCQ